MCGWEDLAAWPKPISLSSQMSSVIWRIFLRRARRRARLWRRRSQLWQLHSQRLWDVVVPRKRDLKKSTARPKPLPEASPAPRQHRTEAQPPSTPRVAADDVFSLPELCAIILRPTAGAQSDLKAVAAMAAASAVCRAWRRSVASSQVWLAACLARWPSTSKLPLAPSTDYRRLYQSRAVAQRLEQPRMPATDVFFVLEMRGRDGRPLVSECFGLGACSGDPITQQRCTFVWEVPGLVLPRSWGFEGCGLWRRADGLMYGFGEWSMARRPGGLYEASGSDESDWEGLYGGGDDDGDDGDDGDDDGEEEDDDMASFIDDDSELGSEDTFEEGEEGEDEEGEDGEEGEEEGDDSDDDGDGMTSPEGSEAEDEEGGIVRASCLLEGDWEPRALLRIQCCREQTPTVELSFELQGERVIRWSKVRKMLEELRWG